MEDVSGHLVHVMVIYGGALHSLDVTSETGFLFCGLRLRPEIKAVRTRYIGGQGTNCRAPAVEGGLMHVRFA